MSTPMAHAGDHGSTSPARHEDAHESDNSFGAPLSSDEFVIGICGLDEGRADKRTAWIATWASPTELPAPGSLMLVRQRSDPAQCHAQLFHASTPARLARLIEDARQSYPTKIIVAILDSASGAERAQLFTAGADDVFDLQTPALEAAARTRAHLRRRFGEQPTLS